MNLYQFIVRRLMLLLPPPLPLRIPRGAHFHKDVKFRQILTLKTSDAIGERQFEFVGDGRPAIRLVRRRTDRLKVGEITENDTIWWRYRGKRSASVRRRSSTYKIHTIPVLRLIYYDLLRFSLGWILRFVIFYFSTS